MPNPEKPEAEKTPVQQESLEETKERIKKEISAKIMELISVKFEGDPGNLRYEYTRRAEMLVAETMEKIDRLV